MTTNATEGLALLRVPFPPNQISKLPKPTKKQTEDVKADYKKGIRCTICGSWHHPEVIHLDYVGHAALTDRLLDTDPSWTWEPFAVDERKLPALDGFGGMWIRLTVCGVTRIGYGHAGDKEGGDAIKEIIGDALRNGSMRFGAALDLWHKGDLHAHEEPTKTAKGVPMVEPSKRTPSVAQVVLDQSSALSDVRKTEIAFLAGNIAKAMEKKGADWCATTLEAEELDDTELIYLSTLLPSKVRNDLKEAQKRMREEARAE